MDILHQLNYLSFSDKDRENILGFKPEQKPKEENHNLSLQRFLNFSKQKRIKFSGLNKNPLRQKEKEKLDESSHRERGKLVNLSDLDPSIINNFKKISNMLSKDILALMLKIFKILLMILHQII